MGRRSDHSRAELEELILGAGSALMAEVGLARFSAREVAKRVGYSIGTIHNVFGSYDGLVTAINTRSFALWADHLRRRLAEAGSDRIRALVEGYFEFARDNPRLWTAIYDHHMGPDFVLPEPDQVARRMLIDIVIAEVSRSLGRTPDEAIATLSRSLVATVHGHCDFAVTGAWTLMGQTAPEAAALQRVREALAGQS